MKKRILIVAAFTAFVVSQSFATGLFDFNRSRKTRSTPTSKTPLSVLNSPKKMTERFGPSILVVDNVTKNAKSRKFVTQPE